ncbi:RNA polymerase sigma factor SigX [Enhygromyxa salina]|uniref:RNA polymerase sigma factor SigX n=1 Tax=Enhygromyxa salina TaxID=215803 RepID=A0A2S9YAR6_9BACT|nr:sigma-70 family RNA polymerase sigma factor [Enhygromyxa salina]PRQ02208.1 RNA polymerase sigma factor SigX [Enhygromyxa salina]
MGALNKTLDQGSSSPIGRSPTRPFTPCLFTIARNAATRRGSKLVLDERVCERPPASSSKTAATRLEQRAEIERVLAVLSSRGRTVLLLSAEGFKPREIATTVGSSPNAIRTRLCRARTTIRAQRAA